MLCAEPGGAGGDAALEVTIVETAGASKAAGDTPWRMWLKSSWRHFWVSSLDNHFKNSSSTLDFSKGTNVDVILIRIATLF